MNQIAYCAQAALLCTVVMAQQQSGPSTVYDTSMGPSSNTAGFPTVSLEEFRLMTIRNIMNSPHPLKKGHVQLHRLGDDAAVDIMKILATRDRPVTKNELLTIFDMLRIAYEKPVAIVTPSNRAPRATLFILKAVDQSTADQDLKKQIADLTKQFTALGSSKP